MAKFRDAASAAVAAGFRQYLRDVALETRVTEFDAAWGVTSNIPGYFSETNAAVFWSVIAERHPRRVVEIGSYQGRSTALLALAIREYGGRLTAVDPHTGDRQAMESLGHNELPSLQMFRLHIAGLGLGDVVEEKVMTSVEAADGWTQPVDLLFDDGWHSYEAVHEDGAAWLPHLAPNGLVCFDDYEHYDEVHRAVDEVCDQYGLTLYGTVLAQAWAGRAVKPPERLAKVLSVNAVRQRVKAWSGRSGVFSV